MLLALLVMWYVQQAYPVLVHASRAVYAMCVPYFFYFKPTNMCQFSRVLIYLTHTVCPRICLPAQTLCGHGVGPDFRRSLGIVRSYRWLDPQYQSRQRLLVFVLFVTFETQSGGERIKQ